MSEEQQSAPEPTINAADLASAEKLIGLTFTDSERDQLLESVNNRAKDYEKLRAVKLDNSVAPALYFDPRLPAMRAPQTDGETPRVYRMSTPPSLTRPANLDDLAFYPLTHLAELVRSRQVTSLELTEMYLERLKRYDPLLHCVVTLTEELAYTQAKRADAGNSGWTVSESITWHSLGSKRPLCRPRLSDDLGR